MIKKEAQFGILFRHWMTANSNRFNACWFELKDTRGKDYISYSEIKTAQLEFADAIEHSQRGVLVRTESGNAEPDFCFAKYMTVYFVIKFPKSFYIINSNALKVHKREHVSLTEIEARNLSTEWIKL